MLDICIDQHDGNCAGTIEWRTISPTISWPRCDFHWDARCELLDQLNKRNPTWGDDY